jgi:hypothetical protein
MSPYLLLGRLNAEQYDFLEMLPLGLLVGMPIAVRQMAWFQHDGVPAQ